MLVPWKNSYDRPRQHIKKQRHQFADRGSYSQSCVFSSGCVQMWELDNKKGWVLTNWWLQTVVLEKTLQSPLNCKEIKPVNSKGNQSWLFIGKTDAEASILLPPDAKSRLIGKDHDAGKDWRQKKKGTTEDEMVGWHYQLSGHEFEQTHLLLLWIPTFYLSITCMSLFYILYLMIPVSETLKTLLETQIIVAYFLVFRDILKSWVLFDLVELWQSWGLNSEYFSPVADLSRLLLGFWESLKFTSPNML